MLMTEEKIKLSDWQQEILKKWASKERRPEITDEVRDRLAREFKGEKKYHELLDKWTSLRVGGRADVLLLPQDVTDLQAAIKIAAETELPLTILGAGSNTLVRDGGVRGFVLKPGTGLKKMESRAGGEGYGEIYAEAGVGISALVNFAKEQQLTGIEELIGIPGTVGGAIAMNAGARGREIKDVIRAVTLLDKDGNITTLPRERIQFEYRKCQFPRSTLILSGLFRLDLGQGDAIGARIRQFQEKRAETQPLNFPNLGSVFKNPQPQGKKEVVMAAAKLIEEAGLKGIRVGGARISDKHANFIVNEQKARAKDVLILIQLVRDKVKEQTGITLETEVKIIGEDGA